MDLNHVDFPRQSVPTWSNPARRQSREHQQQTPAALGQLSFQGGEQAEGSRRHTPTAGFQTRMSTVEAQ